MIALLNFILVVIFVAFIVVCVVAFRIVRSFRSMAKRFSGFKDVTGSGGHRSGSQKDYDGEVVIDRRSPDEANRKIFSKNEGEYVDFEEDK